MIAKAIKRPYLVKAPLNYGAKAVNITSAHRSEQTGGYLLPIKRLKGTNSNCQISYL
jgi:hypothetical protein